MISCVKKMDSRSLPLYFRVIEEKKSNKLHLQYMEQCYNSKPSKFKKTAAGSSIIPRSKSIGWKDKCLKAI